MTLAPSVADIAANIYCYTWHVDLWEQLLDILIPNLSGIRQSSSMLWEQKGVTHTVKLKHKNTQS